MRSKNKVALAVELSINYIINPVSICPSLVSFLDILNLIGHNGGSGIAKRQISAINVMAIRNQHHANDSKQTTSLASVDVGQPNGAA